MSNRTLEELIERWTDIEERKMMYWRFVTVLSGSKRRPGWESVRAMVQSRITSCQIEQTAVLREIETRWDMTDQP
jgi:hypothetical protein